MRDDQLQIARALAVPLEQVSSSALFSNRCFLNNVGYDGTKCNSGDCFLIAKNGQETVVKIETLPSLNCGYDLWKILGKGHLYSFHQDTSGQISYNYWTGFTKVEKFPANEGTFFFK